MEVVDNLYGITMEEPGISKSVNVNVKQQATLAQVVALLLSWLTVT